MDIWSPEKRSAVMSRIRSKNTLPEKRVRTLVFGLGYRYRLHRRDLPGQSDIVLPRLRAIINVHGCFWHQHEGCSDCRIPRSNTPYWRNKLRRNVERDKANSKKLRMLGWSELVIWDCETQDLEKLEKRIARFLSRKDNALRR